MKRIKFVVFTLIFCSKFVYAGFIPSVFEYSEKSYTYQNGLGKEITGNSILVDNINLEWLPLNFSTNYSFNEITNLTNNGNQFSGWRLANDFELNLMLNTYFGDTLIDLTNSANNPLINGSFDKFYPFFGDTYSPLVTSPNWWEYGFGYAIGFYNETNYDPYPQYANALIFSDARYHIQPKYLDGDVLYKFYGYGKSEKYDSIGTFLVRSYDVPEPSTLWVFIVGIFLLLTCKSNNIANKHLKSDT